MRALEYLIYDKQKDTAELVTLMNKDNHRRIEALKVVVPSLKGYGSTIADFYKNDIAFKAETTDALNALVNALVQSSFDLREKRLGEPAGFVIKTKDNPDPTTLEYYNSNHSLASAKAILEAHQQMMGEQSFENLGSFASENGANQIITDIRTNIENALGFVEKIDTLETALASDPIEPNVKKLYDELKILQTNYFSSLIDSLDLTAQIIDADGD
jgi:predicted lipoprotein